MKINIKIDRVLILICTGYLVIYLFLSFYGVYQMSPTGKLKYKFEIAMVDRLQWDPYGCALRLSGNQAGEIDGFGFIYSPLIVIDRSFFHKDILYFR